MTPTLRTACGTAMLVALAAIAAVYGARANHFILTCGDDQPCCRTRITAELYDPDTGTWSPAGNRGPIVGIYVATMLQTGKVLVADAILTNAIPYYGTDAWLFDVAQQTWNQTGGGLVY